MDGTAFPLGQIVLSVTLMLAMASAGSAQNRIASAAPGDDSAHSAAGSEPEFVNPWADRPVCASMFLTSDWRLTRKQRACDWIQNRVFGNTALFGALWSAEVSKVRDAPSERGDGLAIRFAHRYTQTALKSTAAYIGGAIAGEDPRIEPPYLVMSTSPRPRGFLKRTRHALAYNFVSYSCPEPCRAPGDIRRRPALSRMAGALASGYASEIWTWDRHDSNRRALHGAATAFGSTFVSALFTEFKPEITSFAGQTFGGLFGVR